MELTFNPEQEFEKIIGRPISKYEKKELNRFLRDYLIHEKETEKGDLTLTIESALEANSKKNFSKKDLANSLYEYKNTHKIISKELIFSVREACNKYHAGKDSEIKKILKRQNFLEDEGIDNLYSKKTEKKYTYLFVDHYNKIPLENRTKFVSLIPQKAKNFEFLLKKQKDIGFENGLISTGFGLASAIGVSVYGCNNHLIENGGIGFGIFAASWIGIAVTGSIIEKIINKKKKKKITEEIEEYFSDESPYPNLYSQNLCDSEIILHALAE